MSASQGQTDRIEERENILGQFIYAFGQGAGSVRVSRSAIGALRRRYGPPIQSSISTWDDKAAHVLPLLAQVGRLAALLATQAGRHAIAEADFKKARRQVESTVHRGAEEAGRLLAGPLCPPTNEDSDLIPDGDLTGRVGGDRVIARIAPDLHTPPRTSAHHH